MPSFNTNVPHHLNGVSQLPKSLRKDSNAKEQINAYPDLSQGLIKRQPTQVITTGGRLINTDNTVDWEYTVPEYLNGYDSTSHLILEDGVERYVLRLSRFFDLDGNYETWAYGLLGTWSPTVYDLVERKYVRIWVDWHLWGTVGGDAYFGHNDNATSQELWSSWFNNVERQQYGRAEDPSSFSFQTIGDTTLIANSEIEVRTTSRTTPKTSKSGLLSLMEYHASEVYWAEIDGIRIEKTSNSSTNAADLTALVEGIAKNINSNVSANLDTQTNSKNQLSSHSGIFRVLVAGKSTDVSTAAKIAESEVWCQEGDVVECTAIGGDLYYKETRSLFGGEVVLNQEEKKLKKGDKFRIHSTGCTAASSTGVLSLRTLEGSTRLALSRIESAGNTNWSFTTHHNVNVTDLQKFSAAVHDNQIQITHAEGGDFTLESGTDKKGDSPLISLKDSVQNITDLPTRAPNGFQVKVAGSISTDMDDYYLSFKAKGNSSWGEGNWFESAAPSQEYELDTRTMPHLLIKQKDGTFLLKEGDGLIKSPNIVGTNYTGYENQDPRLTNDADLWASYCGRCMQDDITAELHDPSSYLVSEPDVPSSNADDEHHEATSIRVRGLKPNSRIGKLSEISVTGTSNGTTEKTKTWLAYTDTDADENGECTLLLGERYSTPSNTYPHYVVALSLSEIGDNSSDPFYLVDGGEVVITPVYDYPELMWNTRKVGDDNTNPMPAFVGSKITALCYHEGRLGLVSPNGIHLSEVGEPFNTFRTTTIELLDSDPIPVEIAGVDNVYIKQAIPLKESILLCSNNAQFSVSAEGGAFISSNIGVYHSSKYSLDTRCAPVAMNDSIYAISSGPTSSGLIEFMSSDNVARHYKGYDVASSAPTYLPFEVKQLAVLPHESLVVMLPRVPDVADEETDAYTEQKDLYLYKFSDLGNKRQQSALFKFTISISDFKADNNVGVTTDTDVTFIPQIRSIGAVNNKLYIEADGMTYPEDMSYDRDEEKKTISSLLFIDFSTTSDTPHNATITHLDNRCEYNGENAVTSETATINRTRTISKGYAFMSAYDTNTTFRLPFLWDSTTTTPVVVTKSTSSAAGGTAVTIIGTPDGVTGEIVLEGDQREADLYFGLPYTMEYEYHSPTLKTQSQEGGPSYLQGGRHQVNRASIEFEDTGDFSVEVDTLGRSGEAGDGVFTYPFVADSNSLDATTEGGMTFQTGIFSVPIRSKAGKYTMKITTSSHKPVKILSTEYENTFNSSRGLR